MVVLLCCTTAAAAPASDWENQLAQGISLREQGDLNRAAELLAGIAHSAAAASNTIQARAAGELGITLLQSHHYDLAEPQLQKAYASHTGTDKARWAVYLGNLAQIRKQKQEATRYYQEAVELAAGQNLDILFSAQLNLARLGPEKQRLEVLSGISAKLNAEPNQVGLVGHHLNLGNQLRQLGAVAVPLAFQHLDSARRRAQQSGDTRGHKRLLIEAQDTLAQLYEDRGRHQDALMLTEQATELARSLPAGLSADLLINLEWRQGRLFRQLGKPSKALAAFRRAVDQIEAVRQDIPVEYENGRSSFTDTLEPIYLGYADLLLQQIDKQPAETQAIQLQHVLSTMELIRQSEMQDFLGDRCSVETVQGGTAGQVAAGTAVFYPLILPDRIELLLALDGKVLRRTSPVSSAALRQTATAFAGNLRRGLDEYLKLSQQLFGWLLQPYAEVLALSQVKTLVVVPDGVLRLVPMAALHDGKQYAIEKYAISMVTGLSMTNSSPFDHQVVALVAGVSEPGPVVDRLGPMLASKILQDGAAAEGETATRGLAAKRELRAIRSTKTQVAGKEATVRSAEDLRTKLALPGVKLEVNGLDGILHGGRMLDAGFTVESFRNAAQSGDYRILHLASHGVFGGSAETSFIMAYDDLLTMNGLQSLLKSEKFKKYPIELLSLSACQTAEGNDRAPLGISGAAIKARAKSVLGTLWPVEDEAARSIMESVYTGLTKGQLTKTEALRQAQIKLIRDPESEHPFYWAPFVLIGNWL
jgi:CHAT domain-containing protein